MLNKDYDNDESCPQCELVECVCPCENCGRRPCKCKPCRECGAMLAPGEKCSEYCIEQQMADNAPKESERDDE